MNFNFKFICETAARIEPALWRKCNPRIYKHTESYGNPQVAGATLASAVLAARENGIGMTQTTDVVYLAATEIFKYDVPAFFVAPSLAEAALVSNPPADFHWTEMKLPFAGGIFILPKGLLRHPSAGAVDFVAWARTAPGEHRAPFADAPQRITTSDNFIVFTGLRESENFEIYDRTFNAADAPTINTGDYSGAMEYAAQTFQLPLTKDDSQFADQIAALAFRLLLVMQAREEIVSTGRRLGRHKKTGAEIWSPHVVGRGYARTGREKNGETGASPIGTGKRMHWRSGHFRRQGYGAGREFEKIIWLEPTLVGE